MSLAEGSSCISIRCRSGLRLLPICCCSSRFAPKKRIRAGSRRAACAARVLRSFGAQGARADLVGLPTVARHRNRGPPSRRGSRARCGGQPSPASSSEGWRRERDSNPRNPSGFSGFQDHRHRPLGHPSASKLRLNLRALPRITPLGRQVSPHVSRTGRSGTTHDNPIVAARRAAPSCSAYPTCASRTPLRAEVPQPPARTATSLYEDGLHS